MLNAKSVQSTFRYRYLQRPHATLEHDIKNCRLASNTVGYEILHLYSESQWCSSCVFIFSAHARTHSYAHSRTHNFLRIGRHARTVGAHSLDSDIWSLGTSSGRYWHIWSVLAHLVHIGTSGRYWHIWSVLAHLAGFLISVPYQRAPPTRGNWPSPDPATKASFTREVADTKMHLPSLLFRARRELVFSLSKSHLPLNTNLPKPKVNPDRRTADSTPPC